MWRAHRDEKHLFTEELRAARVTLSYGPKHEIYGYLDVVLERENSFALSLSGAP